MKAIKAILLTIAGIAFFFSIVAALLSLFSISFDGGISNAGRMLLISVIAVIVLSKLINYLITRDWDRKKEQAEFRCPECGYNMRGLSEAKCPECGAQFTLDQLKYK